MKRAVVGLFLAALVAGVVGGCGRKGDPQIPAGDKDTLNRVYPTDPNCGSSIMQVGKPPNAILLPGEVSTVLATPWFFVP